MLCAEFEPLGGRIEKRILTAGVEHKILTGRNSLQIFFRLDVECVRLCGQADPCLGFTTQQISVGIGIITILLEQQAHDLARIGNKRRRDAGGSARRLYRMG